MMRTLSSLLLAVLTLPALAIAPERARKIFEEAAPSLVAVQYTYQGELGRRELVAAGVVVSDDGLVMFSINFTPVRLPDQQMKEFKILVPGDEGIEVPAEFCGRDERSNVSFVRPDPGAAGKSEKADRKGGRAWKPVKFADLPLAVGEEVVSVGLLPKTAAYQSYMARAMVAANLRGEIKHVLVTGEGLAAVGGPVFNAAGQAVGWVHSQMGQGVAINDPNVESQLRSIYQPPRTFIPTKEFAQSIGDPPVAGQPLKLPWMGVAQMSGLKKEVAEFFGLKPQQAAVQVGDVIADSPADKAGLKPGNIIVKLNGEALERGDEPDEAAQIMSRKMKRMKVGTQVKLSVITDPNKAPTEVSLTLAERPMQENQARRFYAEDLGFTARQIVFDDTYLRKLPAEQKGVVVALIKPASAAQAGELQVGDLVTKLNQTDVTGVDQFEKEYKEFRKAKPREAIVLEVIRQAQDKIIRIEPPREDAPPVKRGGAEEKE